MDMIAGLIYDVSNKLWFYNFVWFIVKGFSFMGFYYYYLFYFICDWLYNQFSQNYCNKCMDVMSLFNIARYLVLIIDSMARLILHEDVKVLIIVAVATEVPKRR